MYNNVCDQLIGIKDDGTPHYSNNTLLHAGNYAGILDGRYVRSSFGAVNYKWEWGSGLTHVLGVSNGVSGEIKVFSGAEIRNFANAVNKSGDTMTGLLTIKSAAWAGQLNIFRNNTGGNSAIQYTNAEKILGYLGVCGSAGVYPYHPCFVDGAGTTTHKLWHSGNDGAFVRNRGMVADGITNIPATAGMYNLNHSSWYGAAIVFNCGGSNSGLAFYRPGGSNTMPQILLALDGTANWSNMGTILTSSYGTAVAASKLANTRYLWGNAFTGEGNVSGVFETSSDVKIKTVSTYFESDNGTFKLAMGIAASGNAGLLQRTRDQWILGYNDTSLSTFLGMLGNVAIGKTTADYKLDINGDAIVRGWIRTTDQRGWYNETYGGGIYMTDTTYVRVSHNKSFYCPANILAAGEITAYSDERGKECIKPLENRGGVRPVTYIKDGKQSIGFIAQDAHKLYPELVHDDGTDEHWLSFNYMQYTAVLQVQIDDIKSDVERIKEKLGI